MPRLRLPRNVIARIANNIPEAIRAFEQLFDELDIKQDALVSGENIKTINGQSLLGPGDLDVSITSVDWAIITGTPTTLAGYGILDAATLADLALKQDSLVSGTNIKTVNGNSLLGPGDLVVTGGSGISQAVISVLPVALGYAEVIHTDGTVTATSKITADFVPILDAENDLESMADNGLRVWPIPETGQVRFVLTGNGAFVGPFTINYQVAE